MATANTSLRVTELDFFSIRENLKTFLRSQDQFKDFDFEGSGMSVLLDILAYNTHYMGFYTNMVGNEMFLDSAQLRNSVLSHAKNINYIPTSKQGALAKVDIKATPTGTEDQTRNIITLEKYTRFLGIDIDGINYPFVALYSNTTAKSDGHFQFSNVFIKQGEVVTLQYTMDASNIKRRFEIPSANVDTSTLTILVQESSSNTQTTEYLLAEDLLEIKANSPVYFIEENENLNYSFYFGDDVIGKKPKNGNIIICTYLDNVGSVSNNISRFALVQPIGGLYRSNVEITVNGSSYGGVDKETIEQVRFRAPYYYTAQNRAVTALDYETLVTKDYPNIHSVAVWGGEDNDPVVYGKVYLSLKTRGNYELTNFEKEQIKEELIRTRNVLTVTPEIVDPDYVYLLLKGRVNYDQSLTTSTASELLAFVKAAISDYNDAELNTFRSAYRKSRLQNYVDNSEKSILSSDLSTYVQKRVELDTSKSKTYEINFNMPLQKGDYFNKMFTAPEVQTFDSSGVSRNVYFEEVPQSATGVDSIVILDSGINYTSVPSVTISGDGTGATAQAVVRNGRITKINVLTRGINYNFADVIISGDGTGAGAIARLEARNGLIRSYYFNTEGRKVIVNENAGTVDYDSGKIVLNTFRTTQGTPTNRYYDTNTFTVNFPIERETILPLRNRILAIDDNDPVSIQIEMIAEA